MKSVCEIVKEAETNYVQGTTKLGKYVDFSMYETIERIDAYLNSRHTTGPEDSLGREKPFFNIVTAATNVWYRATDIDRKNIQFQATTQKSQPLAFIANVLLQIWMDKNRFGVFLNSWGRSLARYGSSVTKFVEKEGELIPSIVPWNRVICDPVDFDALPRIEKFYKTPAQLRKIKAYDQEKVSQLVNAIMARKTLEGLSQDRQNEFIELYEVHGELDTRLLEDEPDMNIDEKDIKYRQQMHVVTFVKNDKNGYDEFCLYKGKEEKDPYTITHLIEEDGRTLAIGAVEYLFDAQWMQNHTVKNMKDTLDIGSKIMFQTADSRYVGRNILSAIETGDIFTHEVNMPLTRIANDKPDIGALQSYGMLWMNMSRELTSTPDAMRGNTLPSGTPYALGQMLTDNSTSLFEVMTENKGLALEDMIVKYVIPHLKKQLKNTDEVLAILDAAGIEEIDSIYIPKKAVDNFNKRTKGQILNGSGVFGGEAPTPFNAQVEQQAVKQQLAPMGNKRFFKPDELGKKQWDEIFSDFQWDGIKVKITNENTDQKAVLATLSTVFHDVLQFGPQIAADPNAKMLLGAILSETGKISPLQITNTPPPAMPVVPATPGGGVGAGQ